MMLLICSSFVLAAIFLCLFLALQLAWVLLVAIDHLCGGKWFGTGYADGWCNLLRLLALHDWRAVSSCVWVTQGTVVSWTFSILALEHRPSKSAVSNWSEKSIWVWIDLWKDLQCWCPNWWMHRSAAFDESSFCDWSSLWSWGDSGCLCIDDGERFARRAEVIDRWEGRWGTLWCHVRPRWRVAKAFYWLASCAWDHWEVVDIRWDLGGLGHSLKLSFMLLVVLIMLTFLQVRLRVFQFWEEHHVFFVDALVFGLSNDEIQASSLHCWGGSATIFEDFVVLVLYAYIIILDIAHAWQINWPEMDAFYLLDQFVILHGQSQVSRWKTKTLSVAAMKQNQSLTYSFDWIRYSFCDCIWRTQSDLRFLTMTLVYQAPSWLTVSFNYGSQGTYEHQN